MIRVRTWLPVLAIGAVLAAGCGDEEIPKARPKTSREAVKAVHAIDCLGRPFPKDLQVGDWCCFAAKFVEFASGEFVFHGFQDWHEVCLVHSPDNLYYLKKDQRVVIVGRYKWYTNRTDPGSQKSAAEGDGMSSFLPRRRFENCWVYPE